MMRREQTSEQVHEQSGSCWVSGQKYRALALGLSITASTLFAFSFGGCGAGFDIFPEKSSHAGAATGGAIGAGLGAVIGSQTGDALGGAAIGALAGAGAGYAIGDAVSERDDRYALQQQTIERQAAMLRAQQSEIDELRRRSGDSASYGDRVSYGERVPYRNNTYASRQLPNYSKSAPATETTSTRRYIDPATLKNPFAASGYSSSTNYAANTGYSRGYSYDSSSVTRSDTTQGSYSYRNPQTQGSAYSRAGSSAVVGSSLSATVPTYTAPAAQMPSRPVVAERSAPARQVSSSRATAVSPAPIKTTMPVTRSTSARSTSAQATSEQMPSADARQKTAVTSSSQRKDVRGAFQPSAAAAVAGSGSLEESSSDTSKGSASVGIALEVPEKTSELNESSSVSTASKASSSSPAIREGASAPAKMVDSSFNDCEKGEAEAKVAATSESLIDKLFYLRRAQRFCPNEPKWYVELGKIYTSLGRSEDAKTQYEDALQLQSDYAPAKKGLEELDKAVY